MVMRVASHRGKRREEGRRKKEEGKGRKEGMGVHRGGGAGGERRIFGKERRKAGERKGKC